ncbi:MAG: hypothetical protein ACI4PO_09060 [Faecousia sp.]
MYTIDKSVFTAEELEQYEALIAKAKVDPEANQEAMKECAPSGKKPAKKAGPAIDPEMDDDMDESDEEDDDYMEKKKCKKSAPEQSPELKKAMEELADLKKSYEMDKFLQIAKKYAPLGKKEDELAQTLYDMKKSNEANYNAYIAILDESLGIVEKSGIFSEIGKSSSGTSAGGAVAKAEAKAKEIMKADPDMDYAEAIAKAWDDPDLMAEYDAEYNA